MLKHMYISGFKALSDFHMDFGFLNILIGENSCGKSTILQAMDFMRAFAVRDIDEYLNERGWLFEDIIPNNIYDEIKTNNNELVYKINITALFRLNVNGILKEISWSFNVFKLSGTIYTEEAFTDKENDSIIFARDHIDYATHDYVKGFTFKSSFMKMIDINKPSDKVPQALYSIKKFLSESSSLELISPDKIREKKRPNDPFYEIGIYGNRLMDYINNMSAEKQKELNTVISKIIGYQIEMNINRDATGLIDINLNELFGEDKFEIKSKHISDGLLRILALTALSLETGKSGYLLIDEIEDGINPYLIELIINMLRESTLKNGRQVVITTHSPIVLDYSKNDEATFMWRDHKGKINAKKLFSSENMKNILVNFNPGEVWLNYSKNEILELIRSPNNEVNNDTNG